MHITHICICSSAHTILVLISSGSIQFFSEMKLELLRGLCCALQVSMASD